MATAAAVAAGTSHGTHNNGVELGNKCGGVKSSTLGPTNSNNMNNLAGKIKRSNMPTQHNSSSSKNLQISQKATVHYQNESRNQQQLDNIISGNNGSNNYNNKDNSLVGNNRQQGGQLSNFSNSTTKDISRDFSTSQDNTDRGSISDQAFQCSASSVESLPSASGSSTQALVRPGSPNSSLSADDRGTLAAICTICKAKALVDSNNPYDKDALKFKKGDVIDVLSMNASGIWRGFCNGRIGHFKFIDVEILPDRPTKGSVISNGKGRQTNGGNGPSSVEDLLIRIGLKEYTSVFVLNGYEDLELFKEIEVGDLDYLGIVNTEHRAKILASVQLLHEIDSTSDGDVAGSSSENDEAHKQQLSKLNNKNQTSPFGRRHFPRDSGCYEGSPLPTSQINQLPTCDDNNSLDSVVTQCSNEILKRVESARRMMQEEGSKGLARITKKGLLGGSRNTDDLCTRGGALSEKSSDSGVSSSSLSSGPLKNNL
uniref:CSON006226 protein n=1 Tax=Culicoides sonorensis TaxID=179676 RepID=A0A336MS42_CULSO